MESSKTAKEAMEKEMRALLNEVANAADTRKPLGQWLGLPKPENG